MVEPSQAVPEESDLCALRETIAQTLRSECDRRTVHGFIDSANALDETLWRHASELGWFGIGVPEIYGGLGQGPAGFDVLFQEMGRHLAPGPYISTLAAAQWLLEVGSRSIKQALLPKIASGALSVAIPAVTSPGGTLRLGDGQLSGDSGLLLGPPAAALALVRATDPSGGQMWALVEKDAHGLKVLDRPVWDPTRQVHTLACGGVRPLEVMADEDGNGLRILNQHVALAVASDSFGAASSIVHQTIEYMKTRVQFDRPIGSFQALKHRAADLYVHLASAEGLLEQGVYSAARGLPERQMWAALAKARITDIFSFIAEDCMLLHGGIGFTWEYDCHLFLKRAHLNAAIGMDNRDQYDFAADYLAKATRLGQSTAEL